MKTALLIQKLKEYTGDAAHYRLSEPLCGYTDVVVSSATPMGDPETFIFAANAEGVVDAWGELYPGSEKGIYDHAKALANAGYTIVIKPESFDKTKVKNNEIDHTLPKWLIQN